MLPKYQIMKLKKKCCEALSIHIKALKVVQIKFKILIYSEMQCPSAIITKTNIPYVIFRALSMLPKVL